MKIDNFALTMFQTCPAKYLLRMREGWTSRTKSGALGAGACLHEGLAAWYSASDLVDGIAKALLAIDATYPANMPVDDWRTKEKVLVTMRDYAREYPRETFKILGSAEGVPMVENTFTLPTYTYLRCRECGDGDQSLIYDNCCSNCNEEKELIEYGGIFDTLVEFGPKIYVLEHKTTSVLGPPPHAHYFRQFRPNNQVTGYVWAAKQLSGRPVDGTIVNAIGWNKVGATKFARTITTRTDQDIRKWLVNVNSVCQQIQDCELRGQWPLSTGACTQYGKCEFHDVHVLGSSEEQEQWLEQQYIRKPWDYERRDEEESAA